MTAAAHRLTLTDEFDLPEGWIDSTMGQVAEVVGGGTPDSKDRDNFAEKGHAWITPADLSGFSGIYIARGKRCLSDKGLRSCSAVMMPKGCVLMSSRAPIGYVAVASNSISTNQGFKSFVLPDGIEPEFVFFWLKFIKPELENMGSGSTFSEISGSRAKEIPAVLAPVREQKRIVEKVEQLLARVNAARERLARVPTILKRFRHAVLAAACSGRLTAAWREKHREVEPAQALVERIKESHSQNTSKRARAIAQLDSDGTLPELPESWTRVRAGLAFVDARYGTSVKCHKKMEQGAPVLRVPNIARSVLDLSNLKFARFAKKELSALAAQEGDILVCRTNGSLDLIGKAAVIPPLPRPHAFASYLIRLRLDDSLVLSRYFHCLICSPLGRDQIEEKARSTAGQFNLNLEILGGLAVPLPPLEEQREIVSRVETLFKFADAIEARVTSATSQAEKLTQAILAKAFRGELVPTEAELARREGRSYESAADLLVRTRTAEPLIARRNKKSC